MGQDKALLPWGPSKLLDHAIDRLRGACSTVRILCGPERRYEDRGVPVVIDLVPDAGPLGALHTALSVPGTALVILLAVDLPFVPGELIVRLIELAEGYDAVVPVSARGPEPLCAAYRARCAGPVRRRLEAGDLKATSFWPDVRVRDVDAAALAAFGSPDVVFGNLNTPADYARARERAAR